MIMAVAWLFVLLETDKFEMSLFQNLFLKLGFEMKQRQNDPASCSFLKGMWYHTDHGLAWGPLPSRILKMGKSLTDPRTLYKTKDIRLAARRFCSDVAASYRGFIQVPFVKEFVQSFYDPSRPVLFVPPGKTQVQDTNIGHYQLLPEAMDQICARYSCDLELLKSSLALFPVCCFTYLSSPIFTKMVAADYW